MTNILVRDEFSDLRALWPYGYRTAEEIYYLTEASGPAVAEMTGVAPDEIMERLAPYVDNAEKEFTDDLAPLAQPTGALVDPEEPAFEPLEYAPHALEALRPDVNWISDMPPVRDQGEIRQTCTAFAAVAVLEHALGGPALSEQYLYWLTKKNDKDPDREGATLSLTFLIAQQHGVCPAKAWPYKEKGCEEEHCGPPDEGAEAEAIHSGQIRYLNERRVDDIKARLASRKCVAITIPAFHSWYRNRHVTKTGAIELPPQNDPVEFNHSVCLVGYQDTDPAGRTGHFILRNSWKDRWGLRCGYGVGYGTIPYSFIAAHNKAALSFDPKPAPGPIS